jgi:cytochrome b pre-mRNA-processing protein 3
MALLDRIFGGGRARAALEPLYRAIVAEARRPVWYRDCAVPDTMDGRFDMVSSVLALVLLRLERDGEATRDETVLLTELFIEDMDGTLRQIGIGDPVVGKHVGKMMGALGGRLSAFRDARGDGEAFAAAVRRNIFRDEPPSPQAVALVVGRLTEFAAGLDAVDTSAILGGELPR